MPGKNLLRPLALGLFCAGLIFFEGRGLPEPQHRLLALMLITGGLSLSLFFELMARDVALEWVFAALCGVTGVMGLLWAGLALFFVPLPNDQSPLLPERAMTADAGCPAPKDGWKVSLGQSWVRGGPGNFTPFRTGTCPGPSLTRSPRGLMVNFYGYDSSGAVIFRITNNQFTLLLGDYLHAHRPDRSTLGVYDKNENEILLVRYLAPGAVRIGGRFLCGDSVPFIIAQNTFTLRSPSCTSGTIKLGGNP